MKPPLPCSALPSPALALHGHFHRSQRGAGGFGLSTFGSWPLVHDFAQSLLGEYSVSSNPPGPQAVSPPAFLLCSGESQGSAIVLHWLLPCT